MKINAKFWIFNGKQVLFQVFCHRLYLVEIYLILDQILLRNVILFAWGGNVLKDPAWIIRAKNWYKDIDLTTFQIDLREQKIRGAYSKTFLYMVTNMKNCHIWKMIFMDRIIVEYLSLAWKSLGNNGLGFYKLLRLTNYSYENRRNVHRIQFFRWLALITCRQKLSHQKNKKQ